MLPRLSLLVSCCSTKQQVRVSTWVRFRWKSWGLVGHFCVEINNPLLQRLKRAEHDLPKPSANKEAPQHALRRLAKANPQTTPASTSTKLPPWPESGLAQIFGTALPNMSKMLLPPPHHCLGIAFSAKQDKAPRPIDISYLGTKAVMARVQIITQNGPKVWGLGRRPERPAQ